MNRGLQELRKEGLIFSGPGGLVGQNIFHQKSDYLSWILKNEKVIFRWATGGWRNLVREDSKVKCVELHGGCAEWSLEVIGEQL